MDFIEISEINLENLEQLICASNSEAQLYRDKDILYKMYKDAESKKVQRKIFKLLILNEGEKIKNIVIPDGLILDASILLGCKMDYIEQAIPLYRFASMEKSTRKYLNLINNVSTTLRTIHSDPRNIVVGDLNFNNILFDKNMNHYFIDFDSSMVDGIESDRIPTMLKLYAEKRGDYSVKASIDTDKLSLMLNTLYVIFRKRLDLVSMYEYDQKAEKLKTLRNMREYVELIKQDNFCIPSVPYIDEIICKEEITPLVKTKTYI